MRFTDVNVWVIFHSSSLQLYSPATFGIKNTVLHSLSSNTQSWLLSGSSDIVTATLHVSNKVHRLKAEQHRFGSQLHLACVC